MATSDKQRELDRIKWEKSVMLGFDACGSFDYCQCCDKGLENPCEIAHNRFYTIPAEHQMLVEIIDEEVKEVAENKPKKSTKTTTTKKKSSTNSKTVAKNLQSKTSTQKTTKKSTK